MSHYTRTTWRNHLNYDDKIKTNLKEIGWTGLMRLAIVSVNGFS